MKMHAEFDDSITKLGMGIDRHAVLYAGKDKIYRAIHPKYETFFEAVLTSPAVRELMAVGKLISTTKSSIKIDGHSLVLEHPRLPFVTYPFEWLPSMFKDAATTVLEVNLKLMEAGYCIQDAHPWNVLFDGSNPIFVDFTSIIQLPDRKKWPAFDEFNDYCVNSLKLMEKGYSSAARTFLQNIFSYPDSRLVAGLLPNPAKFKSRSGFATSIRKLSGLAGYFGSRASHRVQARKRGAVSGTVLHLQSLLAEIKQYQVMPFEGEWTTYYCGTNELPVYNGTRASLEAVRRSTPKHAAIDDLLAKLKPETLLDIGCNRGLYSQMAALKGAKVIAIDLDERALDQLYHDSRELGTYAIPLYVNAVAPAEASGFKEIPFASVNERLRCDCVLCLALVHHLVFKRMQMRFDHIAKALASLAQRALVVEFVPKEDKHVSGWYSDEYHWYNCENFEQELRKYFPTIQRLESFPSPRVLLCCSK